MKKLFTILMTTVAMAVSCHHEDIWNELREHEERIQKLEEICNKLNSNVEAVQTILTALEQNDYVTDIVKVMEDGIEVGYSITFAKGGTVTIYHGNDGTVPSRRNAELMYRMLVNAGQVCELRMFHSDASQTHHFELEDSRYLIDVTTVYGETIQAPLVYVEMLEFWRRYEPLP